MGEGEGTTLAMNLCNGAWNSRNVWYSYKGSGLGPRIFLCFISSEEYICIGYIISLPAKE